MEPRVLTVGSVGDLHRQQTGREAPKSQILLSGSWLVQAGFRPGQKVSVVVNNGKLLIETSKEEM